MHILVKILQQFKGLFVDNGRLAASILIWIVACFLSVCFVPAGPWQGPLLFIGLALLLIESAWRGAEARSAEPRSSP